MSPSDLQQLAQEFLAARQACETLQHERDQASLALEQQKAVLDRCVAELRKCVGTQNPTKVVTIDRLAVIIDVQYGVRVVGIES